MDQRFIPVTTDTGSTLLVQISEIAAVQKSENGVTLIMRTENEDGSSWNIVANKSCSDRVWAALEKLSIT